MKVAAATTEVPDSDSAQLLRRLILGHGGNHAQAAWMGTSPRRDVALRAVAADIEAAVAGTLDRVATRTKVDVGAFAVVHYSDPGSGDPRVQVVRQHEARMPY